MDEPLRKLMGLADRQEGLVSVDDARRCGVSPTRLRHLVSSGVFVRVHRGVYRGAAAQPSLDQRALAAKATGSSCIAGRSTSGT